MNSASTDRTIPPLYQAVFLALLIVPYFINLGASSLWDANEAFYAETPREMLESGDYLAPKFNYEARAQKPPLTYWVILFSYKVFGISEFSVRLPGALAAAGTVLFTFGIARMLFPGLAGLGAALILATTIRFFALARKLPIDILLLFWLAATAFFLLRAIRDSSARNWLAAYGCAAFGFLTKGPIALLIPFAAYTVWALLARRFRPMDTRPVLGLAVLLAVILPWYLRIYQVHGWEYIETFFLSDNIGRFATESFGPSRGILYYIPVYLVDFFPWSIVSAGAVYRIWRSRVLTQSLRNPALGLPLVWCFVVFVLFSLSKNKQEYYIASIYPMMAVVIAGCLSRVLAASEPSGRPAFAAGWRAVMGAVAVVFLGLAVAVPVLLDKLMSGGETYLVFLPAIILAAAAMILAWSVVRSGLLAGFLAAGAALYLILLAAAGLYLPSVEPLRPVKELSGRILALSGPGDDVGYFGAAHPSMVFYLRRRIFEEYDEEGMARRFAESRRVYCVLTEKDYDNFVGKRDLILYVLDRRPRLQTRLRVLLDDDGLAEQELLLVSNRPHPEQGAPPVR